MKNLRLISTSPEKVSQTTSTIRPILWAIDPTEKGVLPDTAALRMLLRCRGEEAARLQPVHVIPPTTKAGRGAHGTGHEEVTKALRSAQEFIDRAHLDGTTAPEVAVAGTPSRRDCIDRLMQIADKSNAALIAISSHGRSGPSRWWLGSFAEKLLEESPRPLLFLTHHSEPSPTSESTALFATDFSKRSLAAFHEFLKLAKESRLKVVLFYEVAIPVSAASAADFAGVPASWPPEYFDEQAAWAREQGANWVKEARDQGVPCHFEVDTCAINVAHGILAAAGRCHASLLALASTSQPLSRALLGSVAYEVFRTNALPVWLYGPKARTV